MHFTVCVKIIYAVSANDAESDSKITATTTTTTATTTTTHITTTTITTTTTTVTVYRESLPLDVLADSLLLPTSTLCRGDLLVLAAVTKCAHALHLSAWRKQVRVQGSVIGKSRKGHALCSNLCITCINGQFH